MNLQDLRYVLAVEEHRHFGRAAAECNISQPTLSSQVRKLEEELGVAIFERTNKSVSVTEAGQHILGQARKIMLEVKKLEETAQAWSDPVSGPFRLGIIPTLAPYLMPLILAPLKENFPLMPLELWEDLTAPLLQRIRDGRLDAALIATEVEEGNLTSLDLFVEPLLAAIPPQHPLTKMEQIEEADLAADLLVLADGHCLANQALEACGRKDRLSNTFQAANLETLINLVAVGYGSTFVPGLAAKDVSQRGVILKPLKHKLSRTIRLVCRPGFPRVAALRAIEQTIKNAVHQLQ